MINFLKPLPLIFALFFMGCADKKQLSEGDQIKLGYVDNGKVAQAGGELVPVRRIHFTDSYKGSKVLGSEIVDSYELVNADSLPKELRSKYYAVFVLDEEDNILYKALMELKSHYHEHPVDSDYWVVNYVNNYFIDIPLSIDLSKIRIAIRAVIARIGKPGIRFCNGIQ